MIHERSSSKVSGKIVGPGTYDLENSAHKDMMSVLYPKRQPPFNISEARQAANASSPKLDGPGKLLHSHRFKINLTYQVNLGPGSY